MIGFDRDAGLAFVRRSGADVKVGQKVTFGESKAAGVVTEVMSDVVTVRVESGAPKVGMVVR